MILIGLTGGIGSGKSTVAKLFKQLGVPVYDSDKEAKKLMQSSKKIKIELIALFGEAAFKDDKLNRTHISNLVFKDKSLLQKLNTIVHPAVRTHFEKWLKKQESPYVIQESAIIFENNTRDNYDKIILVTAPKETRIQRVMDRDGVSRDKVLLRIKNQFSDIEKIKLSDYVIENTTLKETKRKIIVLNNALLDYC